MTPTIQGKQGKQSKASKRAKKSKGKTGFRPRSKVRGADAEGDVAGQQQVSRPLTDMQAPEGVSVASEADKPPEPEEVKASPAEEAAFEERLASLKADSSLLAKVWPAAHLWEAELCPGKRGFPSMHQYLTSWYLPVPTNAGKSSQKPVTRG